MRPRGGAETEGEIELELIATTSFSLGAQVGGDGEALGEEELSVISKAQNIPIRDVHMVTGTGRGTWKV